MNQRFTLNDLLEAAAKELGADPAALKQAKNGPRKETEIRYIIFSLMQLDGYTQNQIADFFGVALRTVSHGLKKLKEWKEIYEYLADDCKRCERKLLP
jgi:DNA invertase Pin-like site-specific DNA recombinase